MNLLRKRLLEEKIPLFHAGMVHRNASYADRFSEHYFSLPPEDMSSTGENSIHLVLQGLEGAQQQPPGHTILLDEPLLGISESYHLAFAQFLSEYAQTSLGSIILVEHSSIALQEIAKDTPNHIRFGDQLSLTEALVRSPKNRKELLQLPEKSESTRKKINNIREKIMNEN